MPLSPEQINNKKKSDILIRAYTKFNNHCFTQNFKEWSKKDLEDNLNSFYSELLPYAEEYAKLSNALEEYSKDIFFKAYLDKQIKNSIFCAFFTYYFLNPEETKQMNKNQLIFAIDSPFMDSEEYLQRSSKTLRFD